MKTPSRERYLELGICVIGAVLELHDILETEIFDLRKIVREIFTGEMSPVEMNTLMGEIKKTFYEYEEKISEALDNMVDSNSPDCKESRDKDSVAKSLFGKKEDKEDELTEEEAEVLAEVLAELFSKVGLK